MILGLDLGTTSVSGVLFDPERDAVVCAVDRVHDASIPGLPEGRHEQWPLRIASVAEDVVGELVRRAGVPPRSIRSVALTGQQHGVVVVDSDGAPLTNLITWRDQRSVAEAETWRRHAWAAETGCFLHPGYGGLTLHHLVRAGLLPERAAGILPITGFLAARWTGHRSVDETMAASWGLLDARTRRWHGPLIAALGIPEALLPELVSSCLPLGQVVDGRVAALGPDVVVHAPVGDNQAGFAAVGDAAGQGAVINLGTSSQISVYRREYAFAPALETRPFPGGGYLGVYAALCGGWAFAYLAEFFRQVVEDIGGVRLSPSEVFERMQAFGASMDAGGLDVKTRFAGERNGPVTAGSIGGIDTTNLTPARLTRAFAKGIAAELAEASADLMRGDITGLVVVGNAACRNPILVKALEEAFGLPCRLVAAGAGGEAALGAARLVARFVKGE